MAFSEVRQYQPGDDIRSIDWNVTARMNEPYVKVFTEERELTVMLLVDVSASEEFGSREQRKARARRRGRRAARVLAPSRTTTAWGSSSSPTGSRSSCRRKKGTQARAAADQRDPHLPAAGAGAPTSPLGLDYLRQVAKRKAVTFLISDFLARGLRAAAAHRAAASTTWCRWCIADPLEEAFPTLGLVEMEDPETGERFVVDTSRPAGPRPLRARRCQAHARSARALFKQAGAGLRGAARRRGSRQGAGALLPRPRPEDGRVSARLRPLARCSSCLACRAPGRGHALCRSSLQPRCSAAAMPAAHRGPASVDAPSDHRAASVTAGIERSGSASRSSTNHPHHPKEALRAAHPPDLGGFELIEQSRPAPGRHDGAHDHLPPQAGRSSSSATSTLPDARPSTSSTAPAGRQPHRRPRTSR